MIDHLEVSGLLLRIHWGPSDGEPDDLFLEVVATDGAGVWRGSVTHGDLVAQRTAADMSQPQHLALSKKALSSSSSALDPSPSSSSASSSSSSPVSASLASVSSVAAKSAFYSEIAGTAASTVRNLIWKYDVEDQIAGRVKVPPLPSPTIFF